MSGQCVWFGSGGCSTGRRGEGGSRGGLMEKIWPAALKVFKRTVKKIENKTDEYDLENVYSAKNKNIYKNKKKRKSPLIIFYSYYCY